MKRARIRARRVEPAVRRASARIHFGTSGWRGILGEDVDFPRLRVLVRAVADWVREGSSGDRILIGFDGRFASEEMAICAARVLVDEGLRPELATRISPTPAITHALAHRRCAAGLVLTASHNPPAYHGMKVFGPRGAPIPDPDARRIEELAGLRLGDDGPPSSERLGRRLDFRPSHERAIAALLDRDAFRDFPLTVVFDAMHGAAAGSIDSILPETGARVRTLRSSIDPRFGGTAPDPNADNLSLLASEVGKTKGLVVGLATDGDGDRFGVVDGRGRWLTETQVVALLVDHLAGRGLLRRGIAISAATGSLVEKVARDHGLSVTRHPIGFKWLSAAIGTGRADAAGEESGGFAYAPIGPDKDGVLAGCLIADRVVHSGEPLEDQVETLEARFGPSACGRAALRATVESARAFEELERDPPDRFGRARVVGVDGQWGLRLDLSDGGFVMWRRSGTEPLVRVYAEAGDARALVRRLQLALRFLQGRARSR
ncbi:MAG TPA: hypothetical protein ENI85_18870 [Deltaproteobacteria bacterium]|nr:hypothetical protein [Deltaproteobacteria bacterium]